MAFRHIYAIAEKGKYCGRLERPFMRSNLLIEEIINGSKAVPDPQGIPNLMYWQAPGIFRGSHGSYELLINPKTKTILHFNFR